MCFERAGLGRGRSIVLWGGEGGEVGEVWWGGGCRVRDGG